MDNEIYAEVNEVVEAILKLIESKFVESQENDKCKRQKLERKDWTSVCLLCKEFIVDRYPEGYDYFCSEKCLQVFR
jgi:hypothetical protein